MVVLSSGMPHNALCVRAVAVFSCLRGLHQDHLRREQHLHGATNADVLFMAIHWDLQRQRHRPSHTATNAYVNNKWPSCERIVATVTPSCCLSMYHCCCCCWCLNKIWNVVLQYIRILFLQLDTSFIEMCADFHVVFGWGSFVANL